jgi:hypothetical protein
MLRDLRFVNHDDDGTIDPDPPGHFASSRSTARRFFMIARAAFI